MKYEINNETRRVIEAFCKGCPCFIYLLGGWLTAVKGAIYDIYALTQCKAIQFHS